MDELGNLVIKYIGIARATIKGVPLIEQMAVMMKHLPHQKMP